MTQLPVKNTFIEADRGHVTRLAAGLDTIFMKHLSSTGEGAGSYYCATSSSNCGSGGQPIVLGQPGFPRVVKPIRKPTGRYKDGT